MRLSVSPAPGFVVVVLENNTDQPAVFHMYVAQDATDPTVGVDALDVPVGAGELESKAIRCPMALISLGQVAPDFTVDTVGATIVTAGGQGGAAQTQLNYTGSALVAGLDFECGDLIEIELNPIVGAAAAGGQNDAQFSFTIRVIPSR